MARTCANHTSQVSITMCHQCHKPLCKSCTMIAPHGSFCSSECSVIYREFKTKMSAGRRKNAGSGMKIVAAFLAIGFLLLVVHVAARGGFDLAKKVDPIGWVIGWGSLELPEGFPR